MNSSVDRLILQGLYDNQSLSQTLESVTAQANLSLCLYSLSLRPLLFVGERSLSSRFDSLVLQHYKSAFSSGHSIFEVYAEDGAFMICLIRENGNPIALLVIYAADPQADDLQFHHLADRLVKLCSLLTVPDTRAAMHNDFDMLWLSTLILSTGTDSLALLDSNLPKRMKGEYLICAFSPQRKTPKLLTRAEETLNQFFPGALHLLREDRLLLFLYDLKPEKSAADALLSQIREFCLQAELLVGISSRFRKLEQKDFYIQQANECLRWCNSETMSVRADRIYSELFLLHSVSESDKDAFLLHEFRRLEAYDRENGSEYLSTLKAYLDSHNHVNAAASSLFIDHSTLNYRLRKISALLGLDWNDLGRLNALRISLRAWKEFRE